MCPLGVAKTTLWPRSVSTRQLTATSVGSKSTAGVGIKTLAKGRLLDTNRRMLDDDGFRRGEYHTDYLAELSVS
jgi:hypothetical protein